MLSYAFQVLNEQGFKSIQTEKFDNIADLCAAILAKGVSRQLKQGISREYIEHSEQLSALRGRIEITESVKARTMLKRQMVCTYDDFSTNSYLNQIIKTTMELLIRSDIAKSRKKELRTLLVFFGEVDTLDPYMINWSQQYNRNNQMYRMLISICYLVIKGLLQTNSDGSVKLMDFIDEQRMCRLYEKFILEYYKKDGYNNLVLILEDVHKLVHSTKKSTIDFYLGLLKLNDKQLKKLNHLRELAGLPAISRE